jgi:hypothetical protein
MKNDFRNRIIITNIAILIIILQLLSFYLKGNEHTDKQVNKNIQIILFNIYII